jgi:peroxiredoxin
MRFFNKYFFIGFFSGILFLIVVSALGAFVFLASRPGDPAEGMGSLLASPSFPSVEQATIHGWADDEWTLRQVDGASTTFSAFKGKVVFLHFWATWCRPWCVAELPAIQSLYDSLKNEDIAFVLVSEDKDENTLRRFLKEKGFSFPVYLHENETPAAFQAVGVPATFMVARDGSVQFRHVGPAKWDGEASRTYLRGLR